MKQRGARLGQHFLKNTSYAHKLAEAVGPESGDTILEIGPGRGVLTRELLSRGNVVAIEKDSTLVEELQNTFADEIAAGQLRLIEADVRDVTPEQLGLRHYVLAANIPYYITGEIIRQFLTATRQPRRLALLVQKEVAERIIARDGKESILSISVKVYGTPKIIAKVSRGNFSPAPSVDSAILLIENVSKDFFDGVSEEALFKVVRAGFASKRKFLAGNLGGLFGKETVQRAMASIGIDERARAEELNTDAWRHLAKLLG